jgi:hypothetical protein
MFRSLLDRFQWKGTDHIYSLPWIRNRLEYSADPIRVKQYLQGAKVTRSQLTKDMLSRLRMAIKATICWNRALKASLKSGAQPIVS